MAGGIAPVAFLCMNFLTYLFSIQGKSEIAKWAFYFLKTYLKHKNTVSTGDLHVDMK